MDRCIDRSIERQMVRQLNTNRWQCQISFWWGLQNGPPQVMSPGSKNVGFPVSLEDFVGSVRVGQTNRKFARWQGVKQHPFFAPFGWMDGWIDLKKHLNFFLGFAPRARARNTSKPGSFWRLKFSYSLSKR